MFGMFISPITVYSIPFCATILSCSGATSSTSGSGSSSSSSIGSSSNTAFSTIIIASSSSSFTFFSWTGSILFSIVP